MSTYVSKADSPATQAATLGLIGAPSPILSDDPNVPRDISALAGWTEGHAVGYFSTTAARDAAVTAGWLGRLAYVGTTDLYRKRGTAWVLLADTDYVPTPNYREQWDSAVTGAIPSGTWTNVATGTLAANSGAAIIGDATSPVIQVAGVYEVNLLATWAPNVTGRRMVGFVDSTGTAAPASLNQSAIMSGFNTALVQTFAGTYTFGAGQRVLLKAYQDSGASLTITYRRVWVRKVA